MWTVKDTTTFIKATWNISSTDQLCSLYTAWPAEEPDPDSTRMLHFWGISSKIEKAELDQV